MRRAQVREAQKAYRSRQQSQLSSLKTRVEQLEDAFNHLSQTMHSFDDQVIQNGTQWPQPRLFRAVQMLRDDIVSQFKRADIHFRETPKSQSQNEELLQATNQQLQTQATPQMVISTRNDHPSNFWNLFMGSSAGMIPSDSSHESTAASSIMRFSPALTFEPHIIQYATTPFTQRLFRACAESGLRFLSNPSFKVEDMWPEFGLLLEKMPRAEIREYFTRVVSMNPCNPIIDTRFPYISLGGSGTHFLLPSDNASSEILSRFQRTNGVYHVVSDEQWFDVHDIERYLFSQGIGVGDFPSSISSMSPSTHRDGGHLSLVGTHGTSPSNTMMVVDEYKLVNSMRPALKALFDLRTIC
ncbi:uncharacterized protein N7529_002406 [Penicillium soppii]|jgi:hypothetical protein|uniref:uncharacterized protein n=1 Tax=Penicillium soppii TaxID=69789 RepID=UPI002546C177|nr:uncharacterized protein N7529_002406 [Penicillium soppii]KAJ5873976.1 hypothetical protein N7529_002406 [Penicillium soppii]